MTHHSDPPPHVQALIARARTLTGDELTALADAWAASWAASWDAACAAARDADAWAVACADAWAVAVAARDAACAAGDAALALSTRDQLPPEHYRALTGLTIRARVIGRVHPDDPDRRGGDHDA
jgi:hypothetical protein